MPIEVLVVVGPEQRRNAVFLTGGGERSPLRPCHAFLSFDHQAQVQAVSSLIEGVAMVFVPRRAVVSVVVAALAAAAPIGLGACGSDMDRPQTSQAPTALVTIEGGRVERRVPFGFIGLSLEYPAVEAYAGINPLAPDPVFVQLVRNLAPGQAPVLRIGGDSSDRTWWPTPGLTRPPGVKFSIT